MREAWDQAAPFYHEWQQLHGVSFDDSGAEISQLHPGGDYLELGIGTGTLARLIAPNVNKLVGIDASADMVNECVNLSGEVNNLTVHHMDMRTFNLNQQFDVAYSGNSEILCVTDQAGQIESLRTARLHLKPAGVLVARMMLPGADLLAWIHRSR